MASDEREIRTVHSIWIDAVNAGDLARLLTLVAEDIVFLSPGQAPFGRQGFSSNFMAAHQQMQICCTSELEEVVVVGEVAYTRSRDALSVTPRAGGKEAQLAGHRMTVYRKQRDGRWLLSRDVHTLSAVANPALPRGAAARRRAGRALRAAAAKQGSNSSATTPIRRTGHEK